MNFLVVESSKSIRESLCYILLSFGVKGIPVKNYREALKHLNNNKQISGVIVDIDNKDVEGLKLVTYLRENEKTKEIKVIVHTVKTNKDFVIKMAELGIVGYLLKPFEEKQSYEKIKKILGNLEDHHAGRKHIRVKPNPDEMLELHFRAPSSQKLISGKIIDISMGGVAVEMFNLPKNEILERGIKITSLNFVLNSRQFSPAGEIVLNKGSILAFKFRELSSEDKNNLARFIFKRVSQ
ncbi:MAG: response regulator [Spirochaetales bacterium]|nr:response regulator [Spirochaetales bacterium]